MDVMENLQGVGVVPSNSETYSLKQFRDGFDIVTKAGGACEIKCAQGKDLKLLFVLSIKFRRSWPQLW